MKTVIKNIYKSSSETVRFKIEKILLDVLIIKIENLVWGFEPLGDFKAVIDNADKDQIVVDLSNVQEVKLGALIQLREM